MIDMIVDQRLLGLPDGLLDSVELLGQVDARAPFFDHANNTSQMTLGSPQPLDDVGMGLMNMIH